MSLRSCSGWEQEVAAGDESRLEVSGAAMQRNLVILVRSALAGAIVSQAVLLAAHRVQRHLVRQAEQLNGEFHSREERLDQVVARVAIALERDVFEVDRIVVEIGRLPAVMDVGEVARNEGKVGCSLRAADAAQKLLFRA